MYWLLFCKDELFLEQTPTGWQLPQGDVPPLAIEPWNAQQALPDLEGEPCTAIRLDAPGVKDGFRMVGLRESYDLLPLAHYMQAGKARELLHWDETTRFCGVCGGPMKRHTDISKRCTHCGKEVWPSLAPAVIVAVSRGDELLLVQGCNFRADYMGLVAGFVETGESLEEAVAREVLEETGIHIRNIRYHSSQPWPYPNALMLGFMAEYAGGELQIQRSELTKGGWFHRHALPAIPGPVSLARKLIDAWCKAYDATQLSRTKTQGH